MMLLNLFFLKMNVHFCYGGKPSWSDLVRFSFAVGGKDGVSYPVDRKAMDESAGETEKLRTF